MFDESTINLLRNNISIYKKVVAIFRRRPQDFCMATVCAHSPVRTLEAQSVSRALAKAEQDCKGRGERWTPARRRVLELLLSAGGPMKAYDLMASFDETGAPAKPPTVYRALEFLEQQHLAHRIAGINAFIACEAGQDVHTAAFLICDCCGEVEEVAEPATEALTAIHGDGDFQIRTLEAHGRCQHCQD